MMNRLIAALVAFPAAAGVLFVALPANAAIVSENPRIQRLIDQCSAQAAGVLAEAQRNDASMAEAEQFIVASTEGMIEQSQSPEDAQSLANLAKGVLPLKNMPPVMQAYYICIAKAYLEPAAAPNPPRSPPPSLGADEAPLGLKNVPPEAFKPAPEPDRHWMKASMRTDGQLCDLEQCSHPYVEVHLTIDDAYGARTYDWSITRGDTHVFNYPAEAGKSYRFEIIHHPDEKFDCQATGAASGVIDDRFATNADLAQPLFGVTCTMNGAGFEEYNRLKAEKAASDALLQKG